MYSYSNRRQEELEARIVEDETTKRVEQLVAKRVSEELEKRKDEIEAEVLRRVEEAKKLMEDQLLQEMERKRQHQEDEERKKRVSALHLQLWVGWRGGGRRGYIMVVIDSKFVLCYIMLLIVVMDVVNSATHNA